MDKEDWIKTLLSFDKMLAPYIIKALYFLGIPLSILGAVVTMFTGGFGIGLVMLLLGPIFVRLWCEMMILAFSIHENLVTLRKIKVREAKEAMK